MTNLSSRELIKIIDRYLKSQPFPLALLRPEEAARYPRSLAKPSLDVGCGDGFFAKSTFGRKGITTGIDIGVKVIKKAQVSGAYNNLSLFDGLNIPLPGGSQRAVIANCVMEHVAVPVKLLSEISRVTKIGGKFYFSVPTADFEKLLLGTRVFQSLHLYGCAKRYQRFMSWVTRQTYYWPLTKWKKALKKVDFEVISHEEFFGRQALWCFDKKTHP